MSHCIYIHTNKVNGKVYIGQTGRSVEQRWRRNGEGYYNNTLFYRAINKYGWDNFDHKILFDGLTKEEADKKEIEMIAFYDSNNPAKGYNLTIGGKGTNGYHLTEEQKNNISQRQIGRLLTDEWKKNISDAIRGDKHPFYGKKLSDEHRKHLSESHIGQESSLGMLGKKHSDRTKEKMRNAHLGLKMSEETKRKIAVSKKKNVRHIDTGNIYENARQASNETGLPIYSIYSCCNGRSRTAYGQRFEYIDAV